MPGICDAFGPSSHDLLCRIAPEGTAAAVVGDERATLVRRDGFTLLGIPAADTPTRVKVLTRFVTDQGDDPASPHSYANRKILNELVRRLGVSAPADLMTVDLARLQAAARAALIEDSRQREAAGQLKPAKQ